MGVASGLAKGMNDKAELREVKFGKVGARELLGEVLDEEAKEEEAAVQSRDHAEALVSTSANCHRRRRPLLRTGGVRRAGSGEYHCRALPSRRVRFRNEGRECSCHWCKIGHRLQP